jgi:hypothetical protein
MKRLVALALLAGCGDGAPRDCGGDLSGIWRSGERRVHLHAGERRWEIYFLGDDRPRDLAGGVVAGPGVVDLDVALPDGALSGWFKRRYERGATICFVHTAAALRGCAGGRAELELRPPPPPPDWAACARADGHVVAVDAPAEVWALVKERP